MSVPVFVNFALCPAQSQEAQFKNEYLGRKKLLFIFFTSADAIWGGVAKV
jgi:hypothetical protein